MIASYGFFELKAENNEALLSFLKMNPNFSSLEEENGVITANLKNELSATELNKELYNSGIILSHLVKRKESLEEQFLELTKNESN